MVKDCPPYGGKNPDPRKWAYPARGEGVGREPRPQEMSLPGQRGVGGPGTPNPRTYIYIYMYIYIIIYIYMSVYKY